MFQEIMLDVHRQWLAEFDREQARRNLVPRRRRRQGRRGAFAALLALAGVRRERRQPAVACRLPQAPQWS